MLALLIASCGEAEIGTPTTPPTTPTTTIQSDDPAIQLEEARSRWGVNAPDTYWYQLVDDCGECDPSSRLPQTVVIWSGEPTGSRHRTIESLFTEIEAAIEQGRTVEVTYDSDLGHPVDIWYDQQDRAFDGGYHVLIEALTTGLPGDEMASDRLERARELWESNRPEAYEFYTSIHCDCEIAGTIWTRVKGDRIVDWSVDFSDEPETRISPISINTMFEDLEEMTSLAEGVVEDGIRFTGSAAYDSQYGFPVWVGLDIEVLDPDSELAELPPRLVFSIEDFTPVEVSEPGEALTDLEEAQALWESAGPLDYRYEMTLHDIENASFTDPITVTVSNGVVIRVESKGQVVEDVPAIALAIEMLFDQLRQWMAEGLAMEVLYDAKLGFPVFVAVRDAQSPDSLQIFSIERLTPLD